MVFGFERRQANKDNVTAEADNATYGDDRETQDQQSPGEDYAAVASRDHQAVTGATAGESYQSMKDRFETKFTGLGDGDGNEPRVERPTMMVSDDSRRDEPVGEDDQQMMSSEDPADIRMATRTDKGQQAASRAGEAASDDVYGGGGAYQGRGLPAGDEEEGETALEGASRGGGYQDRGITAGDEEEGEAALEGASGGDSSYARQSSAADAETAAETRYRQQGNDDGAV